MGKNKKSKKKTERNLLEAPHAGVDAVRHRPEPTYHVQMGEYRPSAMFTSGAISTIAWGLTTLMNEMATQRDRVAAFIDAGTGSQHYVAMRDALDADIAEVSALWHLINDGAMAGELLFFGQSVREPATWPLDDMQPIATIDAEPVTPEEKADKADMSAAGFDADEYPEGEYGDPLPE